MRLFRKNVMRLALRNKGAVFGSILIIGIGIFILVSMLDTLRNLDGQLGSFYEKQHMADIFAEVEGIPEEELLRLAEIPGIASADGKTAMDVRLLSDRIGGMVTVHLMSVSEDQKINVPILSDCMEADTLYLGKRMQEVYGFAPGEMLRVLVEGEPCRLSFRGTCALPDYVYTVPPWGAMVPDGAAYDIACVSRETMRKICGSDNRTELSFLLEEGVSYEDVRRQLVSELSPWGLKSIVKQEDQASFSMVKGEFGELTSTGTILPAIFMMISVFMLYVVMKKMIDRDQSILGTMKAFGMTDGEMLSAYLLEGLFIGVLGAVIGAASAGILGRYMFALYVEFFNLPDPVYHDYIESRLLGLGLAVGTSCLAVFLGVRDVLGITPAMAMRPKAAETGNYFELPEQLRRRMSAMGRMAARSLLRNPFRGFLVVLAVAFPYALSSVLLSFPLVVEEMLDTEFHVIENYDMQVSLDHDVSPLSAAGAAGELPHVTEAEGVLVTAAEISAEGHTEYVLLHGLNRNSDLWRIADNRGRIYEPPGEGMILNRGAAGKLHVQAGDSVRVFIGGAMPEKRRVTVTAVIDEPFGEGAYMDIMEFPSILGISPAANTAILRCGEAHAAEVTEKLSDSPRVTWLVNMNQARKNYADMMGSMMIMMDAFALMSVAAGGILIYNISMMNVRDRMNELVTLSVLGAAEAEIGGMLLREHAVLFVLGILAGFPGNLAVRRLLEKLMLSDTYRVSLRAYPSPCIRAFLFCLITLAAAWVMEQRMIRRMDLTEALKGRE
ncbi:MAG: ABC transporter permease [Clostridium sp.]|nr:ABC transporter permease [Clostridium sp.]